MMKGKTNSDIPNTGERYDFSLAKAGLDRSKREMAHFVIDNGDHKGHRVSLQLAPHVKRAFMQVWDRNSDEVSAHALNGARGLRLSAALHVARQIKLANGRFVEAPEGHDESNVYIMYQMTHIAPPANDSEMKPPKKDQFKRKKRDTQAVPEKDA